MKYLRLRHMSFLHNTLSHDQTLRYRVLDILQYDNSLSYLRHIKLNAFFICFAVIVGPIRAENVGSQSEDQPSTQHNEGEERIIFVNAPHQPAKYKNNHITTAKYSFLSFIPLFLFEQFRRYSNCFFLFIALMQVLYYKQIMHYLI